MRNNTVRLTERLKIRLNTGKTNGKKTNETRKQLGAQECAIKRLKDEIKSCKIERLSSATSKSDRTRHCILIYRSWSVAELIWQSLFDCMLYISSHFRLNFGRCTKTWCKKMQVFMSFIQRKGIICLWISVIFSLLDFNLCNFSSLGRL